MNMDQVLAKIKADSDMEKGPVKADNYFQKEEWAEFYKDYTDYNTNLVKHELFLIQAFIVNTISYDPKEYEIKYLFISRKELVNFWLMDAIDVLQEADAEMRISGELSERIAYDFDRYFRLKDMFDEPYFGCDYSDGGFGLLRHPGPRKSDNLTIFELEMEEAVYPNEFLSIFTENSDIFYTVKSHKNEPIHKAKVGLKDWEKNVSRRYSLIVKYITKILRSNNNEPLLFERLSFKLNKLESYLGVEKPIDENVIKRICDTFPKKFIQFNNSVTLTDDVEFIRDYFRSTRYSFDSSMYKRQFTGIFFIKYEGKDFPFKEAVEYVDTRPIIFIILPDYFPISMENLVKRKPQIGEDGIERSLIFKSYRLFDSSDDNSKSSFVEFEEYLNLFIKNNVSIEQWLYEHCSFGVYEELESELKYLYKKSLEIFSPVFNVKNNPGSLFQYTLRQKLLERDSEALRVAEE